MVSVSLVLVSSSVMTGRWPELVPCWVHDLKHQAGSMYSSNDVIDSLHWSMVSAVVARKFYL